ncbi:hypothetical protein ASD52_03995 [Ensifer sp. Root142]|nr:hypothetical protein ASD52_03995 [Ensifer sp. Root142]MDP9632154.1 hypothetical protein [Ensifer adhaerens]
MTYRNCPVCKSTEFVTSVSRSQIPILQNRVYDTRDEALQAPSGRLTLCTCSRCGFSYNGEFDEKLITYDEHYNNDVPSETFERYAEDIAKLLITKYNLTSGTVYDVGCGKGTFLRTLCRLAPGIKGIGIDPSCIPVEQDNFTLIQDVFRPGSFGADTKLVILRHVLEHITEPVQFLMQLAEAAPNIPLYVEVPEVNWILKNGAFWDFCYEHCNYFSAQSLRTAMQLAGFSDIEQQPSFGGQYQWAIGVSKGRATSTELTGLDATAAVRAYAASEDHSIGSVKRMVSEEPRTAVWGMATKGVILACLVDGVAIGIDINDKKQGKFAPLSGVEIAAPQILKSRPVDTIIIMNNNYEIEIRRKLAEMGVGARVVVM